MRLSQATKELALICAGHQCQCTRPEHDHAGRCPAELTAANRVYRRRLTVGGAGERYAYANCEVVCRECDSLIAKLDQLA
jgi:hypothetical protein